MLDDVREEAMTLDPLSQIRSAFPPIAISPSLERLIQQFFRGHDASSIAVAQTWIELDLQALLEFREGALAGLIGFVPVSGFSSLFPAWMTAGLSFGSEAERFRAVSVVEIDPSSHVGEEMVRARRDAFDVAQRRAVVSYLRALRQVYPSDPHLLRRFDRTESFWL